MAEKKDKTKNDKKAEQKADQKADKKADKKATPESSGSSMPAFKHVSKKKLSTGKGATSAEIGKNLVELFNAGKAAEVEKTWHHKKIESIEGDGSVYLGKKGIAEKNAWWYANFEVHSAKAEGPFVGATGFAVHFTVDVTPKGGQRMTSREVGIYTVSKGKVVREEFMSLCAS